MTHSLGSEQQNCEQGCHLSSPSVQVSCSGILTGLPAQFCTLSLSPIVGAIDKMDHSDQHSSFFVVIATLNHEIGLFCV